LRLERKLEWKEREERRNIVKGMKEEEGSLEEAVRKIWKLGVEVKVERIRRINTNRKEKREMIIVRLSSEEGRGKI